MNLYLNKIDDIKLDIFRNIMIGKQITRRIKTYGNN